MKFPTYAIVGTLGRCKVLEYVGNGYFRVLRQKNDSTYRVPRDRMQFLPERKTG